MILAFQPFCFSIYFEYMRKRSPAKIAASSPPAPPRISIITFLSSFGSLGSIRTCNSSSKASCSLVNSDNSSLAMAVNSASDPSAMISLSSAIVADTSLYLRNVSIIGAREACSFVNFCHSSCLAMTEGSLMRCSKSINLFSTACTLSINTLYSSLSESTAYFPYVLAALPLPRP